MKRAWIWTGIALALITAVASGQAAGEKGKTAGEPQLAILDTDIGDDIDDAFALSLLLQSPEIRLLGIETAYGDTELRARLLDRFLAAAGKTHIPVFAGRATSQANVFSQAAYAQRQPARAHGDAVQFLLDQIRAHPGEITLVAIGPLVNIGDAIRRDPETFRKLNRVVLMGGSVYRGYDNNQSSARPPDPEWNIARDPEGAKALLGSGVPVFMMPLDSTQIHLAEPERERIFSHGSPLPDQLALLYHQWLANADYHPTAPTLFDPVAAAYAVRSELCPAQPIRLQVDDKGFTRPVEGAPNANVCLHSDVARFLEFLLDRIAPPGR